MTGEQARHSQNWKWEMKGKASTRRTKAANSAAMPFLISRVDLVRRSEIEKSSDRDRRLTVNARLHLGATVFDGLVPRPFQTRHAHVHPTTTKITNMSTSRGAPTISAVAIFPSTMMKSLATCFALKPRSSCRRLPKLRKLDPSFTAVLYYARVDIWGNGGRSRFCSNNS